MSTARSIATRHFGAAAVAALAQRGIAITGLQAIPDAAGSFLNSDTGYKVNDNGCGRVLTYAEVRAALQ